MTQKTKIVVALSGGVDSSVAALLLKNQGHDVIGLFMRNWHDQDVTINNECPWTQDSNDALEVCNQLDIPFQIIDLSKEYKEKIVDYMLREYANGNTPNPDILCNREIKFNVFLKYALKLKADYLATGHYCIKEKNKDSYELKEGQDKNKDQSYFLCQITQEQLKKIIFPIGHLTKKEVREIAKKNNLITAHKKDSQGLCFVGKIKLPIFLQQKIKPKQGDIVEIEKNNKLYQTPRKIGEHIKYTQKDGMKVGQHTGSHQFTIGQRKGVNIGGRIKPLFVISTDIKSNIVYVGMGEKHPGLFQKSLKIKASFVHWLIEKQKLNINEEKKYLIRIRHRQGLQKGLLKRSSDYLYIIFDKEQRGIARGQFAAWYDDKKRLIGSGPID